ncbi:MAG: amino acid ABC transporter substrate-binding protein [Chloroflexi bacterium]|nr:amino acid ABC transporter substrate-binding protein [Chloroflexota bacterium]
MTKLSSSEPVHHIGRLALVICHLLPLIVLSACASPDAAWDRVRETGILRVGMDASFPPFEAIAADGMLVGFDVDLALELGRRLGPALSADATSAAEGVEVQFVANLPYDGLYDALAVGADRGRLGVDVVISALVVNPARVADFAYSTPYFDAGQVLVVRVGETAVEGRCPEPVEGMTDLSGCTLAVEFGTRGDLEARKWARRLFGLAVVPHQTAAEALEAAASGEADAALVDRVSALAVIGVDGGLAIVGEQVVEEPYAVVVCSGSQHLLQAINEALEDMEADGTMERLVAEWLEGGS